MDDMRETGGTARAVFAGLTPSQVARAANEVAAGENRRRMRQGVMSTMPIMLAGAMTVSMNLTGPVADGIRSARRSPPRPNPNCHRPREPRSRRREAAATQAAACRRRIRPGDLHDRARRHRVRDRGPLRAQHRRRSRRQRPRPALAHLPRAGAHPHRWRRPGRTGSSRYTIVRGDTISGIAQRHGLTTAGLLAANNLSRTSIIYPGQTIVLSGSSLAITPVSNVTPANPPSTPPTSAPAPVINNTYTIARGDTITSIAARFGVGIDALLNANGLSRASIIYAGRTLTIPGVTSAQDGSTVTPLTAEMAANARIIIQVGRSLGVNDRGLIIALAAAMQESSLRNVNYGDRDSLGVFQQRPSTGWGTPDCDPRRRARHRACSSEVRATRTAARPAACSTSPVGSR